MNCRISPDNLITTSQEKRVANLLWKWVVSLTGISNLKIQLRFYITLGVFSIIACSNPINNIEPFRIGSITFLDSIPKDVENINRLNLKSYVDRNKINTYYIFDSRSKKVFFLDQDFKLSTEKVIDLKYQLEIFDITIDSDDQILAVLSDNIIARIGKSGTQYFYPDSVTSETINRNSYMFSSYDVLNDLKIYNNEITLYAIPQTLDKSLLYSNLLIARIKLDSEQSSYKIIGTSPKLSEDYVKNYYFQLIPLFQESFETLYYVMNDRPVIYSSNFKGEIIKEFNLPLSSFKRGPSISIDSANKYPELEDEYYLQFSKICSFKHDNFRNKFYIIYNKPVSLIDDSGYVNQIRESPFVLCVLDSHLNVIEEIAFPGRTYEYARPEIFEKGILMPCKNKTKYKFDVFNFDN